METHPDSALRLIDSVMIGLKLCDFQIGKSGDFGDFL